METRSKSAKRKYINLPGNCQREVAKQAFKQAHQQREQVKNKQMKAALKELDRFLFKHNSVIQRYGLESPEYIDIPALLFPRSQQERVVRDVLERLNVPVRALEKKFLTYFDEKQYIPNNPKSRLMYALIKLLWEDYLGRSHTMNLPNGFPAYKETFKRHSNHFLNSVN